MFEKRRALAALVLIYLAVVMNWNWVWGVLFLYWSIPSLYSGQVHLVDAVNRDENPFLFWLIIGTWVVLSLYMIAADIFPSLGVANG